MAWCPFHITCMYLINSRVPNVLFISAELLWQNVLLGLINILTLLLSKQPCQERRVIRSDVQRSFQRRLHTQNASQGLHIANTGYKR